MNFKKTISFILLLSTSFVNFRCTEKVEMTDSHFVDSLNLNLDPASSFYETIKNLFNEYMIVNQGEYSEEKFLCNLINFLSGWFPDSENIGQNSENEDQKQKVEALKQKRLNNIKKWRLKTMKGACVFNDLSGDVSSENLSIKVNTLRKLVASLSRLYENGLLSVGKLPDLYRKYNTACREYNEGTNKSAIDNLLENLSDPEPEEDEEL
jgi:hypothetical protein